eukprot:181733-Prorocentrum_minimum.AAC.1
MAPAKPAKVRERAGTRHGHKTRTLYNRPSRPYQAVLSLENSILPPTLYRNVHGPHVRVEPEAQARPPPAPLLHLAAQSSYSFLIF